MDKKGWFFVAIAFISLVIVFLVPPIFDPPSVNDYADQRSFFGIPNFNDVITNIFFLIFGLMGLWRLKGLKKTLWSILFLAIIGIGCASIYYQLDPTRGKLFWDRFFIGAAFMTLLSVVLEERISQKWMKILAPILILSAAVGIGDGYWTGDLRPYLWMQFFPLVAILLLCLFIPRKGDRYFYGVVLFYVLAKVCDNHDGAIFNLTHQMVSGHTLKHLSAAVSVYFIYRKSVMSYNVKKK